MRRFTINIAGSIILLFAFASCEKIIDLQLNQTEDKLVVEAIISNLPNGSFVKLTKSNPLFSAEPFKKVEDAKVSVKTDNGDSFSFSLDKDGVYKNDNFIGTESEEYKLEINWNDISVSAKSYMPKAVDIDSIEVVVSEKGFMGNEERAYSLKVHFTDPSSETNYYKFDLFKNDTLYDGFSVSNDLYYNGISTYQFFMNYKMKEHDTICVQLSAIDKANYNYFQVLSQSGSPFIIAPGNPISNISGNAIGYFGAFSQSRKYFIVPELDYNP